ncbi:MAG: nucleoside deaminase [Bacilli bacterium]|nr:nucleoside deaminase [Bacilli bacterium]
MNEFMDVAIDLSDDNFDKNYGGPFGSCVVKDGKIIGKGINRVIKDNDPTAHAEVIAIRNACKTLGTHDLTGCEIYTSCYPCPMCLSAIIWANIKKVYYANTKEDAADIGFRDDFIYDYLEKLTNNIQDKSVLNLKSMNREDALEVFKRYEEDKDKIVY